MHGEDLCLRDAEAGHVGPVQPHFAAQDGVQIDGEDAHQLRVPGLDYSVGKDPCVIEKVPVVLQQKPPELLQRQGAVADAPDKGMGMAGLPHGAGGLVQTLCYRHTALLQSKRASSARAESAGQSEA